MTAALADMSVVGPCPHAGTSSGARSWKTYCETSAERRFDLHGFQRCFPDRAAAYFRATGLSAAEIAVAFGVDARTAKNWLEGIVAPRGDKVAVIALRETEGFRKHFGEVAA